MNLMILPNKLHGVKTFNANIYKFHVTTILKYTMEQVW
jgi:hypothetical protein